MTLIEGNMGDVPDYPEFDLIPEGWQEAFIFECEQLDSKSSGQPYLKWAFSVPMEGADTPGRVWDNTSLQPQALWKLKSLLKAVGQNVDGEVSINSDALLGRPVRIRVVHEEYRGKKRPKVEEYGSSENDGAAMPAESAERSIPKDDLPF